MNADEVAMKDSLQRVLRELDSTDRKLIGLRLEGHSTAEAARRLDLNPDVTRVRLSRLRRRLEDKGVASDLVSAQYAAAALKRPDLA